MTSGLCVTKQQFVEKMKHRYSYLEGTKDKFPVTYAHTIQEFEETYDVLEKIGLGIFDKQTLQRRRDIYLENIADAKKYLGEDASALKGKVKLIDELLGKEGEKR